MDTPDQTLVAYAALGSNIATIVGAFLLVVSVVVAIVAQRRATAAQLWDTYLAHAIQYPMFAFPPRFIRKFDFDKRTFCGKAKEFERYEWFVSSLLRASEEIIAQVGAKDHRAETALHDLEFHQEYFKRRKKWGLERDYLDKLNKGVKNKIKEICEAGDYWIDREPVDEDTGA